MRELFPSLDKVRWHKRFDKCASLSKLLRYKMATKDILSGFETFLNLEKVLKEHDSLLSAPDELSEESASSIMAVLMSLESFMIQKNQFTEDTLLFDRTLNIIKCHIILHNHQQALRLIFDQNKSIIDGFKIVERSQDYSKYTWRLVAEVLIGACSIVYDRKDYAGYLNACFQFSCTAVEILFELIRFQESVIVKHVKSTSSIYRELVDLLLWASYYFSVIGCKLKVNLRDIRYSLLVLVKNVNILNSDGHEFIVPIHKLRISMYLIEWFRFDLENPEETIKCIFSLAVPDILTPRVVLPTQTPPLCIIIKEILVILNSSINQDLHDPSNDLVARQARHVIEICIDIAILLLSQSNQYSSISALNLKYQDVFFEDPSGYCLLACSFFSSGHYTYSLQTCKRVIEFDPSNSLARSLLLHILINVFEQYEEAVKFSTQFLHSEPQNPDFYHSRAVANLEKSFQSVYYHDMKELQEACLSDVLKAISLDDNDSEQYFIASLVYGCMGDLDNALLYAFEASKRSIFDSRPYHMTFLVFVAKNLIDEALRVLADMEHEFPSDFSIILNKVEMDHYLYGPEVALASIKTALETWYQLFNHTFSNLESQEGDDKTTNSLPGRSIIRTIFPRKDNPDTRSVFWLFNTSKTPKFQSQMTFSFFNDIKDSIILLALLLQKMAMIYLELRSYESAKKCIDDIKSLGYVFPEVYLLDAMYHKGIGSVEKYKEYLETALYLNPNHVESLHQLVLFYLEQYDKFDDQKSKLMNLELAEETARHLVKVSPKNFISWQVLGRVLHEMNVDIGESLSCFSRALELKDFVSIIPFKRIVRRLKPNDLNVKTVV